MKRRSTMYRPFVLLSVTGAGALSNEVQALSSLSFADALTVK